MLNDKICEERELIPLLIKYKKVFGVVFPIERVKYLTNEEVINKLLESINNNIKFDSKYNKIITEIKVETMDLKYLVPIVKESLNALNYSYDEDIKEILDIIELRNNGKTFTFAEHLKALIITQLQNHRWGDSNVRDNSYKIDAIFHNYNKDYLKLIDYNVLLEELKKIHCTNPMSKNQLQVLSYNIEVLEKIEKDYGSLDNYVVNASPNDIANAFNEGKYKLKQVGRAFAFDYLKRVGINTCKTSVQMQRLFGANRLGLVENAEATGGQVLSILKKLSTITSLTELELETMFQSFCLLRSANICGEQPRCEYCKLRKYCNHSN